jgi:hypothetical protein
MFGRAPRLILGRELDLAAHVITDDVADLALRDLSSHAVLVTAGDDASALANQLTGQVLLQDVPCIIFDTRGSLLTEAAMRSDAEFFERVSVTRYDPGSGESAGIFAAYMAPPDSSISWQRQGDLLRDHIARLCRSLLDRLGLPSDPATSREHVLLAAIFESAWRAGQRINPADLVQMINHPPLSRVGEFDMDVFIPTEQRTTLALAFSELASSGIFGHADDAGVIDAARLLQPDRSGGGMNPAGRTRATVFDVSGLDSRDRCFFASTVMAQLLLWMRLKSGVPHLRCVVYIADADTFTPEPVQALLRFGRAAGFGIVVHTERPVELVPDMLTRVGLGILGYGVDGLDVLVGTCPAFDRDALAERAPFLPEHTFLLCVGPSRDRPQTPLPAIFRLPD